MRLIFIGPPGAGKGTQAAKFSDTYKILHLSTGDILRANRKRGTELGLEAQFYMDTGELVPDDLVLKMVAAEFEKPDIKNGFVLDGFPRTAPQASALDKFLIQVNYKLDHVLVLDVPVEELVARLTARRTCRTCGMSYHLIFNPPKVPGICDFDGGELYQRQDDTEATVRNRLGVYERETRPLINYYAEQGLIRRVNGVGTVTEVFQRLQAALE